MAGWQLAQLNIAQLQAPLDSPQLSEFVANLDRINALADQSSGFVWRLIEDNVAESQLAKHAFFPDTIVTLSVWESIEALHHFVYQSDHAQIMRRKKEWFERMVRASMVLWWLPQGTVPTAWDARAKLDHLQANGPTQQAFSFRQAYPSPSK